MTITQLSSLHQTPQIYAPEVVANQNFDMDALAKIIGLIILCVSAIFLALTTFFCCCNEEDALQQVDGNALPANAAGCVRVLPNFSVDPTKTSSAVTQDYIVNAQMLSVTPPRSEDLWKTLAGRNTDQVQVVDLMTWYNTLFQPNLLAGKNLTSAQRKEISTNRASIQQLIIDIAERPDACLSFPFLPNGNINPHYGIQEDTIRDARGNVVRKLVKNKREYWLKLWAEIKLITQNLILEFRNPETPIYKKQEAISKVAVASRLCRMRLREEGIVQFRILTNTTTDVVDKFIVWAQMIKEDIILANLQDKEMHVLTLARQDLAVAKPWGLDRSVLSQQDIGVAVVKPIPTEEFLDVLEQNYQPVNMVELFHMHLLNDSDWRGTLASVNELFQAHYDEIVARNEDLPDYFDTVGSGTKMETILNYKGVAMLAEICGHLNPPDGVVPIRSARALAKIAEQS